MVAILLLVEGIMLTPCLAYILWRIYKVHSKLRGLKPVVQMFNDKKIETSNISTLMTNRLHALETRLTSLLNSITTPGTELVFYKPWARTTTQERFPAYGRAECNSANDTRNCKRHGHGKLQGQTLQEVPTELCHRC